MQSIHDLLYVLSNAFLLPTRRPRKIRLPCDPA